MKEHVLVTILATSGAEAAYAGDIVAVQDLYYHQDIGPVGGLLLLLTTQLVSVISSTRMFSADSVICKAASGSLGFATRYW